MCSRLNKREKRVIERIPDPKKAIYRLREGTGC